MPSKIGRKSERIMQLGTKGRYAVMAMTDLAGRQDAAEGRAVALADIAARQEISLSYLEQLFSRLRRRGLVISARGPGGGYRLAKSAQETLISDIIIAVDEPLKATRCNAKQIKGCMSRGERCVTHDLWDEMGRRIQGYLASVSLADVIHGRLGDNAGAGRSPA
jgi:Rrf2 family transcriptional regulator, iron-sulfur cluster assembly transcription factor